MTKEDALKNLIQAVDNMVFDTDIYLSDSEKLNALQDYRHEIKKARKDLEYSS